MPTSIKIPTAPASEVPLLELIDPAKYAFGVRDMEGNFKLGDFAQTTVVFDKHKIGRGVELTFEDNFIEVRLCAPSATSDYELFVDLVEKLIQILNTKELICEEENLSVTHLQDAFRTAKINLKSGLDFLTSISLVENGPVAISGVFQQFTIDPATQKSLRKGKQPAFNNLLYSAQQVSWEASACELGEGEAMSRHK